MIYCKGVARCCAVLIEGPKWSGKTRTAQQAAKSVLMLQDPDSKIISANGSDKTNAAA
jgi:hypothetical protein